MSYQNNSAPRGNSSRNQQPPFNAQEAIQGIDFGSEINAELFGDIAQAKARLVAAAAKQDGRKNKSTQLRRFYDELVMWNDRVQTETTPEKKAAKYTELAPYIKMLNAKVAYAKGREHVDDNFVAIYSRCIKQIQNAETLKQGKLFIEAFMGFYKAEEK
jgi:CRISPR-associated protein Csm2